MVTDTRTPEQQRADLEQVRKQLLDPNAVTAAQLAMPASPETWYQRIKERG